jgi:glucose-1-phosphate adenylyltransferase
LFERLTPLLQCSGKMGNGFSGNGFLEDREKFGGYYMQLRVLAFVLAGGKGTRLYPLTKERAKPAVPFGGRYRIVDFVLSNLVNSGVYSIYVLVQFKSQSLLQHLREGWEAGGILRNNFIIPVPAQMRTPGEDWYRGTADAIFQNINLIEQTEPHLVVIFGADHIYRMNIREMIEFHVQKRAQVTVSAIPVDKEQAIEFGVVETTEDGGITGFHEKKPDAPTMPGDPSRVYASMGNYIFSTKTLLEELYADSRNENSSHDFGRNILPGLIGRADMFAYDFQTNRIPGDPQGAPVYWRDVGTLDAYFEASMDLRAVSPILNLYNRQWPLRTAGYSDPPAKFIFDYEGRRGQALDSIVSGGTILSGGLARGSVLGRGVKVHSGALVEDSIIFDNCDIGRRARVRRAILDKNVRVPEDATIGYDLERDRQLYYVTDSGIVVVEGHRSTVDIATVTL